MTIEGLERFGEEDHGGVEVEQVAGFEPSGDKRDNPEEAPVETKESERRKFFDTAIIKSAFENAGLVAGGSNSLDTYIDEVDKVCESASLSGEKYEAFLKNIEGALQAAGHQSASPAQTEDIALFLWQEMANRNLL
jgi:hypothetical protein